MLEPIVDLAVGAEDDRSAGGHGEVNVRRIVSTEAEPCLRKTGVGQLMVSVKTKGSPDMEPAEIRHVLRLVQARRADDAAAITRSLVETDPNDLLARAYHGVALRQAGQASAALSCLHSVLDAAGRDAAGIGARIVAHMDLGAHHTGQQDWAQVADHLERVAALTAPTGDVAGRICMAYAQLGNEDKAKEWGAKTIAIKDGEGTCDPSEIVPRKRPQPFDPRATSRNVISHSLFGSDRYYHECAVTTARMVPAVFPEFCCRFYCAPETPDGVLAALRATGAQVIVVRPDKAQRYPKYWALFWRFLAFDDPGVDVVLVRDVDRPAIPRERAAIDLWLRSDAPFYALRDAIVHAEPLLAGLWGGFTGLLPEMRSLIARFVDARSNRFVDQSFLRLIVWPRIREATLCIDRNYNIAHTVDYPEYAPKIGRMTVGRGWFEAEILGRGQNDPPSGFGGAVAAPPIERS